MANPNEGEGEWVEFYFPNDYFDLTGYYLEDTIGKKKNIDSPQICGKYAVFELSEGTGWLNNGEQETVSLFNQDNVEVDSRSGKDPGKGKTLGRTPDGSDSWNETESPTKCAANSPQKSQASENSNQSTATPSPSPNPANPSPLSSSKPKSPQTSAQNTKQTPVLGQKTTASASPEQISLSISETGSPSPSPSPAESQSVSKTAGIIIGVGAIALASSLLMFLWYKWEIKSKKAEEEL